MALVLLSDTPYPTSRVHEVLIMYEWGKWRMVMCH